MINVKPIPDELLGDDIVLITPTGFGSSRETIYNVRVEKQAAITDYTSSSQRENTTITVWYDCENSYPEAEFPVGAKVEYGGEIFEIVESKVYKTDVPHHKKFKARKIAEVRE